jgi:signal transduction histidine kinase
MAPVMQPHRTDEEGEMRLAEFITTQAKRIIAEWEEFARLHLTAASAMDLKQRRDHVEGMLEAIATDLGTPQTKHEQARKSTGKVDARVGSDSAANAHGTDRAATGFSPIDLISEFRALRASVLRLWGEPQRQFSLEHLEDVTRFNEAIDQLLAESMARYARDVERSKDMFLGVLGHDLRNPLGAIMMSATVMMTSEGPSWPHQQTAARILTAGTRMDALIGDLADFTRARLGAGMPIVRRETDLEMTCRHTVDELTAFHPDATLRFTARGDLHGRWDGNRIAQALSNLCGNALQHGAPTAPIEVTLTGDPAQVVLAVHNQGRQIPKDRLHEIFEPFRQLQANRTPKDERSVGLGLYIVRAIATAHHGSVEVESAEHGTTFTMRLPRVPG